MDPLRQLDAYPSKTLPCLVSKSYEAVELAAILKAWQRGAPPHRNETRPRLRLRPRRAHWTMQLYAKVAEPDLLPTEGKDGKLPAELRSAWRTQPVGLAVDRVRKIVEQSQTADRTENRLTPPVSPT